MQDVMVVPALQHQRIGTTLMEAAIRWLKGNAPKGAFIGLFTGKPQFYQRYGFENGGGMSMCL